MSAIEVTTQAQLDKAVKELKPGDWIVVLGGTRDHRIRVSNASVRADGNASVWADGNASVEAYGNASVWADGNASVWADGNASVEADGNASVEAYGKASVRADGNASVWAYGNASVWADGNVSVEAYGNASVWADGNASVWAYGKASVRADGNASVEADGNASVWAYGKASVRADGNASVRAGKYVAIHKFFNHHGKISGGVVIALPDFSNLDAAGWCDYRGVIVQRGFVLLYKAVDDDFATEKSRAVKLFYTPGSTVTAPDWNSVKACGNGLHACSLPWISRRYNRAATRFVQVKVKLADIVVIDEDKVKVPSLKVVCECDRDGVALPVEVAK